MIVFKYREELSKLTGKIKRPVADIKIRTTDGRWIEFNPYIDSGADITLLPYTFGRYIGFESLRSAKGAEIPVEIRRAEIKIGHIELNIRVAWALIEETPPLLGRLDIFDKFNIIFKEREGKIIFEPIMRNVTQNWYTHPP